MCQRSIKINVWENNSCHHLNVSSSLGNMTGAKYLRKSSEIWNNIQYNMKYCLMLYYWILLYLVNFFTFLFYIWIFNTYIFRLLCRLCFGLWVELLCHDWSTGPNNLTDPQRPNVSKQKHCKTIEESLQSVLGKYIAVLQLKQLTVQSGFGLSYSNFLYESQRR